MRRLVQAAAVLLLAIFTLVSVEARQTFVESFNFRNTQVYVTDGTDQTYVLPATSYPTTKDGSTHGWTTPPTGCANRSTGVDVRLAGLCYGDGIGVFRVDLPGPGTYDIRLAMGDQGSVQTNTRVRVWDNATQKLDIGPWSPSSARFYDANNNERITAATWVSSNTPASVTFASSILLLTLEADATSNSVIAHLSISGSPDAGGAVKRLLLLGVGGR